MRSRILLSSILWLAAQCLTLAAEAPASTIELYGIIAFGEQKDLKALLEVTTRRPPGPPGAATLPDEKRSLMLAKGQREGEIEVVDIDQAKARVTLRNRGQILELALGGATPAPGAPAASSAAPATVETAEAVSLAVQHRLNLSQALNLYEIATRRSVIRPSALPVRLELELQAQGTETGTAAAKLIEHALAGTGLHIQLDGEKFAIVTVPGAEAEKITRQLGKARELAAVIENTRKASAKARAAGQPSASRPEPSSQEEMLPAGTINFPQTDVSQVLAIYAELTDRTLIRSFTLPAQVILFRNYPPLTREESIYALTAVLAVNGISVAAAGEKFLLVVPTVQEGKVAKVLSREGLLDYSSLTNRVLARSVDIPNGNLERFAEVYGKLAGRKIELGSGVPRINLGLRLQTELTTGEALQALDLLLGLNGLKVTSQGDLIQSDEF